MSYPVKDKIKLLFEQVKKRITPLIQSVDVKVNTLIPNPKIKRIAYIGIGSLFGFMFLLIIIGILVSPFRNKNVQDTTSTLKKPINIISTPEPQKELSASQKEIIKLGEEVKNLTFPESVLNLPIIERDLSI